MAKKQAPKNKPQAAAPNEPPSIQPNLKPNKISLPSFFAEQRWGLALLIFMLSSLVYLNTLSLQYAVDDSIVILRNKYTKKGMKGMKGIWNEDTFEGFFGKQQNLVAGGRYRPLSVASFALEIALWGEPTMDTIIGAAPEAAYQETTWQGQKAYAVQRLDEDGDLVYKGNPMLSHAINVLLFGWLCALIFFLLAQLFEHKTEDKALAGFIGFVSALLYALHPLHTEAVANIKGRDEILVSLCSLLALHWIFKAYLHQENKVKLTAYGLGALVSFGLGIFAKENAITFVGIIPLALYVFSRAERSEALRAAAYAALPLVVITLYFWFKIRANILNVSGSMTPVPELMNDPFLKLENGRYVAFSLVEKLSTCLYTWAMYLKLLVFPHPLTNDYYPKHIHLVEDSGRLVVIASIGLHLGLACWGVKALFERSVWAFVIGFYAATFSVVSNLFFAIGTTMAERFMFLPSLSFSLACALGLASLYQRGWAWSRIVLVLGLVGVLYGFKTFSRNYAWYDDYTLFTTDIPTSPNSAKLNNAVSGVLQDKALTIREADDATHTQREGMYNRAREHAIKAIELHPTYNSAWLLKGNSCVFLGEIAQRDDRKRYDQALAYFDEAIAAYKEVLRLRPDHPDVKRNFGVVYRNKGKLLGQTLGRIPEAVASLEEGLRFNDEDVELYRLGGVANGIAGKHDRAMQLFDEGLKRNPQSVALLYNLSVAYRIKSDLMKQQGQITEANNLMQKANELTLAWQAIDPNYNPQSEPKEQSTIQNSER